MCAGVDRPELFERSTKRRPLRLHDLRATFVTISRATGKIETWVADCMGHRSSEMRQLGIEVGELDRYRRTARTAAEMGLGELADMCEALSELPWEIEGGRFPKGTGRLDRGTRK